MGQLVASIAHEVNQPLAAVVANANASLRWLQWNEPRIDKALQALARIVRDGNRASEIITRARTLVGKKGAPRTPLSLNSTVYQVLALVRAELRRSHISVRTKLAERLPLILADRIQMQQVLLNLIMNAIEAMRSVGTESRLLAIVTSVDSAHVRLAVKDSGVGLGPQSLERVFEPFYSTKPDGMGIGLAVSRSIVEAHGGWLRGIRNKGAGATFEFGLPRADGVP
jgi:C4-dicarboxylate-specific signal transduction histidine kinase